MGCLPLSLFCLDGRRLVGLFVLLYCSFLCMCCLLCVANNSSHSFFFLQDSTQPGANPVNASDSSFNNWPIKKPIGSAMIQSSPNEERCDLDRSNLVPTRACARDCRSRGCRRFIFTKMDKSWMDSPVDRPKYPS